MKRGIIAVVVMLVLVAFAGAQEQTDNQILGIELGFAGGYRLNDTAIVGGQSFGLNFTVANNVQAGFATALLSGGAPVTDTYGLFRLSYFLNESVGMNILVGGASPGGGALAAAGGAGVFLNAFQNRSEDSFSTALKVKLEYLFNITDGIDGGSVVLGVASVFGL